MANSDLRVAGVRSAGPPPGLLGRLRELLAELLAELFPEADERRPGPWFRWGFPVSVVLQILAVCAGAVLLLFRVAGVPAWDSVYNEDNGIFLVQAIQHPWHLLVPYAGYLQLVPRLLGQIAALVPLPDVPRVYAVSGALIAACCALFLYHASAGHVRSRWLRVLLGAALVLLPVAPLEIADSGVNSVWYLLVAMAFATLWRPSSARGRAAAALVGFAAVASNVLALLLLPLLVLRVIALPRVREHAVTLGCVLGCLLQVPVMVRAAGMGQRHVSHLAPVSRVVPYYLHSVVLRVPGWHLSWWLTRTVGVGTATALAGGLLLLVLGVAAFRLGRPVAVFTVMAVVVGFAVDCAAAGVTYTVAKKTTPAFEWSARYSVLPIMLITAALIVSADAIVRRRVALGEIAPAARETARRRAGVVAAVAALALTCGLAAGWVTDFRYVAFRSQPSWSGTANRWIDACRGGGTTIVIWAWDEYARVSCHNIHV